MSTDAEWDFDTLLNLLEKHEIHASPSEVHGMLSGLLCGGASLDNENWLDVAADFFNQGLTFSPVLKEQLDVLFKSVWRNLIDEAMAFEPMVPDQNEPLHARATALCGWTQGFLLGFGVNPEVLKTASDEVNEAIRDFAEFGKMDTDLDDSEDNESAFFELFEYIRISALLCFNELGENPLKSKDKITLH